MAQQITPNQQHVRMPLRQFFVKSKAYWQSLGPQSQERRDAILEATTLSYCIANLLYRANRKHLIVRPPEYCKHCCLENFLVRLSVPEPSMQSTASTWKRIVGVDMIVPSLSLDLIAPAFLNDDFGGEDGNGVEGRYLEIKFKPSQAQASLNAINPGGQSVDESLCHLVGSLMYELLSGERPPQSDGERSNSNCDQNAEEPARKRAAIQSSYSETSHSLGRSSAPSERAQQSPSHASEVSGPTAASLHGLGLPRSIILLVDSLLECGKNSSVQPYDFLKVVCKDLHRAILDPSTFLFPPQFSELPEANESIWFRMRETRLYGRSEEKSKIRDAFLRAASGFSEAIFIGGKSGVGKTKLVQSVVEQVKAVAGFVVMEKFDQMENGRYSSVITAFNSLCFQVAENCSREQLQKIASMLMDEFYSDFALMAELLPGVYAICPQLKNTFTVQSNSPMNTHSVCFILQRFVKVVSSKEHPVLLFLDDLQWADELSLGLLQSVLFDLEKTSCFFFVGSYRTEEVNSDHAIFSMICKLETCGVQTTKMELEGLDITELNEMIADILYILPCHCWHLADVIFRSTEGNPFFSLMYLESLIDSKSICYSLNEQRWVYDVDRIRSDPFAGDIISLVASKISGQSMEIQSALKTMACFGSKMQETVLSSLSLDPQHSNIVYHLNQAVEEHYIEKSDCYFMFIHDKFREAAFSLIPKNLVEEFHYRLAVLLHSHPNEQNSDDVLFAIVDQLKRAPSLLNRKHSTSMNIPELFVEAGSKAFKMADFARAQTYLKTAESLLPHDHWSSNYNLCLRMFLLLGRSCYAFGLTDEATAAIDQVLGNAKCFEDKLDAYHLLASMSCSTKNFEAAYKACCEVLSQLGQTIPESLDTKEVADEVGTVSKQLENILDKHTMEEMKEADERTKVSLKFYSLACTVVFFSKPKVHPLFVCNMVQLSITKGVSAFSTVGFASLSMILCNSSKFQNIPLACRIGRFAMSFEKKYILTEQMPLLAAAYHGFVSPFSEPLQTCSDMHRRAYEVGITVGDISCAFLNPMLCTRSALLSGANLKKLQVETNKYLKSAIKFGISRAAGYIELFRDTISILAGETTPSGSGLDKDSMPHFAKNYYFHVAIRSFWLRHHDRCEHAAKNFLKMENVSQNAFNESVLLFVQGLNLLQIYKVNRSVTMRSRSEKTLQELKRLAKLCPWNFKCKAALLEAEILSFTHMADRAEALYDNAIQLAKNSQFVHEEGLANELAANYYLKSGKSDKALSYLNEAKLCYDNWGSRIKVDYIENEINRIWGHELNFQY